MGGLAGFASGSIYQSYVIGEANQQSSSVTISSANEDIPFAGGLVGHCNSCKIHQSSAEDVDVSIGFDAIHSNHRVGGLVGMLEAYGEIGDSYVRRGKLTALAGEPDGIVGLLVGEAMEVGETLGSPTIERSFSTATASLLPLPGGGFPDLLPLDTCLVGTGDVDPDDSYFPDSDDDYDRCGAEATDRFNDPSTFEDWDDAIWDDTNLAADQGPDHKYRLD